jgi:hypothetical protein
MIRRSTPATTAYANPELVRELEKALADANTKAHSMGAMVLQGRATQEQKEAAYAEAEAAQVALKAEQKNIVNI